MSRLALLLALSLCLAVSARAESAAKAIDLFGGKDFAGLEYIVTPATDSKAGCSMKADGVIAVAGTPIGYLATTASYEN